MTPGNLVAAFFIACCFALWPFMGKYAGVSGQWLAAAVMLTTGLTALALPFFRGDLGTPPDARAIGILLGAGVLNGIGCYVYGRVSSDAQVPTSSFVIAVTLSMCVLAPVVGALILKQVPSPRQWAGFALAAGAAYLLR